MFATSVDAVDAESPEQAAAEDEGVADSDDEAVIAGTLRSPWRWEELVVESAVVGGRTRADGGQRWRRRLGGLAEDYRLRINELKKEEPESARIARYERDLKNLQHLRAFALPIVDALAAWPDRATWGEWLTRSSVLAERALRRPARVLETLASLRPMADVGPVGLEEVRDVLRDRLVMLDWDPPARRYGRVFVGTPHQARGRTFKVVFVPGLAERVVPQRPHEDPLLLDDRRRELGRSLVEQDDRKNAERLLLKLSIGAAEERLYLSYPRLDVAETRARVPSFYALDVVRAITGDIPDHRQLASDAAAEAGASLAWPAPKDARRAIDDLEHDLASLKPLLESRDAKSVRGHAHYLLQLNECLRRSVISRWARGRSAWSQADGLIRVAPGIKSAMDKERLANRPYSLSALQRFSSCPYQFLLATIYRLEPREEPEPLVRLDPLTRGSLFHRAQAEFYREMRNAGALPVTRDRVAAASKVVDAALDRVAEEYKELLAPAIERVWRDEIDELRRDLGIWVQKMIGDDSDKAGSWVPEYFEFSFGLSDEGRDERSLKSPVTIDGRFVLRGSVDLIERSPDGDVLRITDHKTGKNRSNRDLIIGGGGVLQPVLYSAAVEQGLGKKVAAGRLYYCTTAGGFAEHAIPINDYTRTQGLHALTIVDRAIEQGFLVAAPAERACTWCDFKPVCGPREEERVKRKAADRLADLEVLRGMR
jgi:CRISPR/Cas system-associated exonuclease Cas4 (RecB family)